MVLLVHGGGTVHKPPGVEMGKYKISGEVLLQLGHNLGTKIYFVAWMFGNTNNSVQFVSWLNIVYT